MKIDQPFIISLLFHLCLLLLLFSGPEQQITQPDKTNVEIVYQNETHNKKQTVESPEEQLKSAVDKLKKSADKFSKYTQRVDEESKSAMTGPTQNSQFNRVTREDSQNQKTLKNSEQKRTKIEPDENGNLVTGAESIEKRIARDTYLSYSTTADYLPNVKNGGFTALNSDQFMFYTFYARINEQLRNRWVSLVRQFLDSTPQAYINQLSNKTQVTQLDVLLTPDGQFAKAIVYRKADAIQLDEIAVSAFRQATPFVNPPSDIVVKDGFIHLQYELYIQLQSRFIAKDNR